MTVRVTMAPLSVMTCTLVDGAIVEDLALVLRVDDKALLEGVCIHMLANIAYENSVSARERDEIQVSWK